MQFGQLDFGGGADDPDQFGTWILIESKSIKECESPRL
jgi:hypothetical protein